MGNNSFLSKLLFVCAFVILLILITFFVINKGEADKNMKEIELITSVNADTYDKDMYIYDYDGTSISVSQYFYNKYYLQNHTVKYEKYNVTDNSHYYIKNLSNTEKDVNDIKISYDPIDKKQFEYLLENYNLLKVYIWLDNDNNCKNILLYSSSNIRLEFENVK